MDSSSKLQINKLLWIVSSKVASLSFHWAEVNLLQLNFEQAWSFTWTVMTVFLH